MTVWIVRYSIRSPLEHMPWRTGLPTTFSTMPDLPLILLPPSEGKYSGGNGATWTPGTMRIDLDTQRRQVVDALIDAMSADHDARQRLLGVKADALDAATGANKSVLRSPTAPAIERYTGVLYDAIDVSSLESDARAVLDDSVLIMSGLWGLVSPRDPIPNYKLKMGARLEPLGRLSTWWRSAIGHALDAVADAGVVWNLLPKEHDAALTLAWIGGSAPREHYSATFLQPNAKGELVAVSHWNKFLKGALVRHLVEQPGVTPVDLLTWEHPSGFRLNEKLTLTDERRTTLMFVNDG